MNPLRRFAEVLGLGQKDVGYELLWIAIDEREPRALHLDHYAVTLQKHVVIRRKTDFVRNNRTRRDRFRLFPQRGKPAIRNEALNDLLASVKVVVGDSCNPGFGIRNYWSDRAPELLGRGPTLLIHPWIQGMDEHFTDREHLAYYPFDSFRRLRELIDHYLREPDERGRIGKAGQEHVRAHHTYGRRVETILERVLAQVPA